MEHWYWPYMKQTIMNKHLQLLHKINIPFPKGNNFLPQILAYFART